MKHKKEYFKVSATVSPGTKEMLLKLKEHLNAKDMGKFDNSYIINLSIKKLYEKEIQGG
jgi:hypothetical protein